MNEHCRENDSLFQRRATFYPLFLLFNGATILIIFSCCGLLFIQDSAFSVDRSIALLKLGLIIVYHLYLLFKLKSSSQERSLAFFKVKTLSCSSQHFQERAHCLMLLKHDDGSTSMVFKPLSLICVKTLNLFICLDGPFFSPQTFFALIPIQSYDEYAQHLRLDHNFFEVPGENGPMSLESIAAFFER